MTIAQDALPRHYGVGVVFGVKILAKNCPIAVSAPPIELSAPVMADVLPVLEATAMAELAALNRSVSTAISPTSVVVLTVLTVTRLEPEEVVGSSSPTEVVETDTFVPTFEEPDVVAGSLPSEAIRSSIAEVPGGRGVEVIGFGIGVGGGMRGL